jgi:DNA-directed RNA polymerase sigma subunit (sigma70/sigma32)
VTGDREADVSDDKGTWAELMRTDVQSLLAALTPQQAKALRARFGIDEANRIADDDEATLRALAGEPAMLKGKSKP